MNPIARVRQTFLDSIETKRATVDALAPSIARGADMMASALRNRRKILSCGNGGSAADAQHFAAELVNRFEMERPGLAGMALSTDSSTLTSIANDYDFRQVFARQVEALGSQGDVLLAITTSGHSPNILAAMAAARAYGIAVILLSGRDGGEAAKALAEGDLEIRVPVRSTARIQEVHILVIHCLCDLIDQVLFTTKD